ncbi:hypothetical protein N9Y04_06570 [Porticoccaceae bacterium]|jgi:hypothetical protein|nr:hypothetical protein [Porticoccaceae bacterium]MDB2566507.1 hypothetical protein [Porticoccaceae bacterium]MDB2621583.1 hypothetical protein [Porticoccaceae bacterium]
MLYESDSHNESQHEDDEDAYLMSVGLAFNLGFEMFKNKFASLSRNQVTELHNLLGQYDTPP